MAANPARHWTFLSNHAHVLVCLALNPDARLRDVAAEVGITERAVQGIVGDLEAAGVIVRCPAPAPPGGTPVDPVAAGDGARLDPVEAPADGLKRGPGCGRAVTPAAAFVLKTRVLMARKRTSPALPHPAPGSACLEAAVREQQRRIAAASALLDAARADDIHGARVAARRLRSMLKTFRPLFDDRRAQRYRADLRVFARSLGAVREADVRRALLLGVAGDASLTTADRQRLTVLLDDACRASREQLRRQLAEPGWTRLGRALQRAAASDALFAVRDAGPGELAQLAERAWRRPVKLLRRNPTSTVELHELRLAFKHCRYALEPIAEVAPKATARLLRRLRAAQDRIGEHRDTLLAEHWVRENERALGRPSVGRLVASIEVHEKRLRRQSATRAAKVLDAWRAWRDATRRVRQGASRDRA
jgi:CHAD domain-containing protein